MSGSWDIKPPGVEDGLTAVGFSTGMFPKLVLLASIASLCFAAPNLRGPTLSHLFPVQQLAEWSTSTASAEPLAISDSTFDSHNILSSLPREVVTAPDGVRSMKAHYPRGSYTFGHNPQGGFSFYGPGPSNVDLTTAKEATFAYSVYFPSGFDFMKGGKLPGGCRLSAISPQTQS